MISLGEHREKKKRGGRNIVDSKESVICSPDGGRGARGKLIHHEGFEHIEGLYSKELLHRGRGNFFRGKHTATFEGEKGSRVEKKGLPCVRKKEGKKKSISEEPRREEEPAGRVRSIISDQIRGRERDPIPGGGGEMKAAYPH